jgi:hypothetical protein
MTDLISEERTVEAWRRAIANKKFLFAIFITLGIVLSFTVIFNKFFDFVEARQGTALNDFLVESIPGRDVSFFVFFFLYSGIVIFLLSHSMFPAVILTAFQTYVLVTLTRIGTITLFPLEPPVGYIPLREPFVQLFTTNGNIISKDLFFSGHMSTILSVYFASRRPWIRRYIFLCAFMVGAGVIVQHVHYTIDVLVAIPATFFWYWISKKFLNPLTRSDS